VVEGDGTPHGRPGCGLGGAEPNYGTFNLKFSTRSRFRSCSQLLDHPRRNPYWAQCFPKWLYKNNISHTSAAQNFKIHYYQFLILTFMQNPEGDFPLAMASSELTWINVVISLTFVLFDIGVSRVFRLGIGLSLLIAGLRCVGQLTLVATVLHKVFETQNPWLVSLICCAFVLRSFRIQVDSHLLSLVMLNFLGTFETGTSTWYVLFDKLTRTYFCSYEQIFPTVSLYGTSTILQSEMCVLFCF
jgi:ABC-type iron transport system FetAB permease component